MALRGNRNDGLTEGGVTELLQSTLRWLLHFYEVPLCTQDILDTLFTYCAYLLCYTFKETLSKILPKSPLSK